MRGFGVLGGRNCYGHNFRFICFLPSFWFVTKNARIHTDIFLAQLLAEVNEIQWDVVCLSETRAEDGNYTLDDGHRLFCGRNEFKYAGVSILVHARWTGSIVRFCKVSDRVVYGDLLINDRKYRIIAVYVPHGGYE